MARGTINRRMGKVGYRLGILLLGALAFIAYTLVQDSFNGTNIDLSSGSRLLSTDDDGPDAKCFDRNIQSKICIGYGSTACKKLPAQKMWMILGVVAGLLYLFIGIAIVCDELFVPALEIIAEDLNLSNDVAGATLMAAGGSAPELATSFVGVFKRSDVGFGTIVGSAVFNVLFVIGMCAMFTPAKYAPLELTWWPLARDCSYYVLTLATLAVFMSDGKVELHEAFIQFLMYIGYVILMMYSERLQRWVQGPLPKDSVQIHPDEECAEKYQHDPGTMPPSAAFTRPSTFRAGVLQLLTSKSSITETAGVGCVSQIKGDVNEVFERIDENKNGIIERNELRNLLLSLGTVSSNLSEDELDNCLKEIDTKNNGVVTKAEFVIWYTRSEERIKKQTRDVFNMFDTNQSGTIDKHEIKALLLRLGNKPEDTDIDEALKELSISSGEELSYETFESWYTRSMFWTQQTAAAEEAAESSESMWEGVKTGWKELFEHDTPFRAKIAYIVTLPLSLLFCLVPDCRPPGKESRAPFTFIMSIFMIAICAIFMVELAEIFGGSLGIPDVVMGLTILAAGTSVPDLLSSVIVAKQGEGDMAVSSSIGSNIFDVAFGLPVPWMVFNIVSLLSDCKCPVIVQSDGLFLSLLVLLLMVAAIVVTIKLSNWKMTRTLGWIMFTLYFAYVIFSLLNTPKKDYKVQDCSPFNPLG